jgi:hypothetical protein
MIRDATMTFKVPEKYRVKNGIMGSDSTYGNNGMFIINSLKINKALKCQASDGYGYEHVSVSAISRCPVWEEMCFIKDLFWDAEDCVIQYHPPKSEYINCHPHCLHLWRPIGIEIPRPPSILVGF